MRRPRTRCLRRPRLTQEEREELSFLELEVGDLKRPRRRADCGTERPCPFVSCKYHLYLDVNPITGSVKINSHVPIEEMEESCALDIAEKGGEMLDRIGTLIGLTRERIRQVQDAALQKLKPLPLSNTMKEEVL